MDTHRDGGAADQTYTYLSPAGYSITNADGAVTTQLLTLEGTIGESIDAVFIATPNHQHALPATIAMHLGKPVYCEKPLTHDIAEARALRKLARQSKAPTQMGNQGHCEDGYRRLCEFVDAGIVGKIVETHSWTDRANGGVGPRPPSLPPPELFLPCLEPTTGETSPERSPSSTGWWCRKSS